MATTPRTRVTSLARRYRLDIDTGTSPAVNYQQLLGLSAIKLTEELRTTDDETVDDDGAMREEVTGYSWQLEGKLKNSVNAAGTSRDAVHAFLRTKFLAAEAGPSVAGAEFGVRFYDRNGLAGDAREGRAYVKTWTPSDDKAAQDEITIVIRGQGALAAITNPASSQVPVVDSVTPSSGDVAGGELVIIGGNHFTGATAVAFGAADAPDFQVLSDSQIAVVTPAVAASTVQVKVTTAAGASVDTAADNYTFA